MTVAALNLTEQYQCPVIMLSDGSLAFSTQTIPTPDPDSFEIVERTRWDGEGEYMRYKMTESLISPMADPGTPGAEHVAASLEHLESGAPSFAPEPHEANSRKRFNKIKPVIDQWPAAEVDGEGDADVGIITWGSTIGVVREAVARLQAEGKKVKAMYPKLLYPMPVDQYEAFAADCKQILVPEVNYQGQLSHFIRAETSIKPVPYTICGGLPFTPAQIVNKVKEII